jgi:Ser/Thr protein kinase RdoA (MazF antagonist)
MSASKNRPRWGELPLRVRCQISELAGGRVVAAENCEGGFSPGFASRLTLADKQRVFVKAMDVDEWPLQATFHRAEARVAAALPQAVPAPRFLGSADDGHWVILAFEWADGAELPMPWRPDELSQAVAAAGAMSQALTPSPVSVPANHTRLGGWADLAADTGALAKLPDFSAWAAGNLDMLIELERAGLTVARGDTLVHFDALPHNILRTDRRVLFVDWPHARLGAPFIDLLTVLASAGDSGIDLEELLASQSVTAGTEPGAQDAVLAALTGFWLAGGLAELPPALKPIAAAKLRLGRSALSWLERRLGAASRGHQY